MVAVNEKTGGKLEIISFWSLVSLAFFLPIFVLPFAVSSIASSKAILLYSSVLVSAFLWLLGVLRSSQIKIPKSSLLAALAAVALTWLFASLFSGNAAISLLGKVYDIDTFSVIAFAALLMFLSSILFQSEKRIFTFYFLLFISSFFLFLFQFLHIVFKIDIIPFKVFQSVISNPLGGWNDFAVFFGFIGLISLAFFEFFKLEKWMKLVLFILLVFSMLSMMTVNFLAVWIIFGFFALVFFVFLLYRLFFLSQREGGVDPRKFLSLSLFVVIISAFFIYDHIQAKNNNDNGIGGKIGVTFNANTLTVRPSWLSTWNISKQVIKSDPVLGSGPNTFLYDWFKFKPAEINKTIFWNTRFSSGIGYLPSVLATTGLLGGLTIIGFFFFFLSYGAKIISNGQHNLSGSLALVSFLGAAYLWAFNIFYAPGLTILVLAFMMTGITVAIMARNGKMEVVKLSFLNNTKTGFISILITILFLIGSVYLTYSYSRKFLALHYYGGALEDFNVNGDLDTAEKKLTQAIRADAQDEYLRALSEINLIKTGEIVADSAPKENTIALFSENFGAAIKNAQEATKINSLDPINWMQLGRVYGSVVSLNIEGADEQAIYSYSQAANYAPFDPAPLLASAKVKVGSRKIKEARDYIKLSLNVKPDFAPALFLLAQIEAQEGNLKEAILKTEQVASLSPNDIGVFFQLGLLYYQDNNLDPARLVFERAVELSPDYANARYFLGLIYDKKNMKEQAIEQFEKILTTNADNEEIIKILSNLRSGKSALAEISPPKESPEKRENPPVEEESNG